MKPKFKNTVAWQQAELLMQPAFIRVLDQIRKKLDQSSWKVTYENITNPIPGYQVRLQEKNTLVSLDLWELCYQVCFLNYSPAHSEVESKQVEIDTSLIDENGEVDWHCLDTKARELIEKVFAELPTI